jgi:hypothetical protein
VEEVLLRMWNSVALAALKPRQLGSALHVAVTLARLVLLPMMGPERGGSGGSKRCWQPCVRWGNTKTRKHAGGVGGGERKSALIRQTQNVTCGVCTAGGLHVRLAG